MHPNPAMNDTVGKFQPAGFIINLVPMLRVGMQIAALRADIPEASVICQEIKAEKIIRRICKTYGTLKISAQSATACIPTRSMGTSSLEFTNSIIHCRGMIDTHSKSR